MNRVTQVTHAWLYSYVLHLFATFYKTSDDRSFRLNVTSFSSVCNSSFTSSRTSTNWLELFDDGPDEDTFRYNDQDDPSDLIRTRNTAFLHGVKFSTRYLKKPMVTVIVLVVTILWPALNYGTRAVQGQFQESKPVRPWLVIGHAHCSWRPVPLWLWIFYDS